MTQLSNDFREIVQKEGLEAALNNKYGTLNVSMRLGKTNIGLKLASNFKNVLVAYPNKPIKQSWLDDSSKFNIDIDHITFTTFNSFTKYDLSEYDAIIIDEIHDFSINNFNYLLDSMPERVYGLTGSPPNRGEKVKFMNSCCPIIYTKQLDETTGITNKDYEIIVHLIEPSSDKNIKLKSGKTWSDKQRIAFFTGKYNQTYRFTEMLMLINAIKNSPTKYKYAQKLAINMERGLVFLETSDQCDRFELPTYHSKESLSEENLALFKDHAINKMTTIAQLKAGITFKDLSEVIILHCYSSNNKTLQRAGRALNYEKDKKAKIHILCLKGTIDEQWVKKGLAGFDTNKITYYDAKY